MDTAEKVRRLIGMLLEEMPEYRKDAAAFFGSEPGERRLLRSLMNLRPPWPLAADFLVLQDEVLAAFRAEKGVVDAAALPGTADSRLVLWKGDITRLKIDAIVNAANSVLLGCFWPCHGCVDNAIHSAAGLQLRAACRELMAAQDSLEPAGRAKITPGYNLPARYVLHTVGPVIEKTVTAADREALAGCYRSCLALAAEKGLSGVAFCCISTGEFHFPNEEAAEIAVTAVRSFLQTPSSVERVVFDVYQDADERIYRRLLGGDR